MIPTPYSFHSFQHHTFHLFRRHFFEYIGPETVENYEASVKITLAFRKSTPIKRLPGAFSQTFRYDNKETTHLKSIGTFPKEGDYVYVRNFASFINPSDPCR